MSDLKHALCLWLNNSNYRNDPKGILFNDRLFNIPVIKDVWDEEKRRIKVLKSQYLSVFITDHQNIMNYKESSDYITNRLKGTYNPRTSGV